MASLKDIRSRIDSTKNTQQITKAMKLVSAAKLRKAQNQITNMRPYAHALLSLIANIVHTERVHHPLITRRTESKKVLLVVLSSDRGLCGSFNSSISRFVENYLKDNKDKYETMDLMFIGRRAADYFARRGVKAVDVILRMDKDISYTMAAKIAERAMEQYLDGAYDEVRLVYNEFKSAISQKVMTETLLPVDLEKAQSLVQGEVPLNFSNDMLFEPAPEKIIDELLNKHFAIQVYRCMAESVASEHGARMTAMENASNNARDVLAKLTLTYNKVRQEKITTELIEIVAGAEAL